MIDFKVGEELYWNHGEHHGYAKVIEISGNSLTVMGLSKTYKISIKAMRKKLEKAYPIPVSGV